MLCTYHAETSWLFFSAHFLLVGMTANELVCCVIDRSSSPNVLDSQNPIGFVRVECQAECRALDLLANN
jgi:hypothetical protein